MDSRGRPLRGEVSGHEPSAQEEERNNVTLTAVQQKQFRDGHGQLWPPRQASDEEKHRREAFVEVIRQVRALADEL